MFHLQTFSGELGGENPLSPSTPLQDVFNAAEGKENDYITVVWTPLAVFLIPRDSMRDRLEIREAWFGAAALKLMGLFDTTTHISSTNEFYTLIQATGLP